MFLFICYEVIGEILSLVGEFGLLLRYPHFWRDTTSGKRLKCFGLPVLGSFCYRWLFFQNQTSFICACITWPRNCPMADRIASIICPWLTAPCVAISVDMDRRSKVASASPKSCTCDPPPKRTGLGYLWFHSNNGLGGKYVLHVSCVQRELLTRY